MSWRTRIRFSTTIAIVVLLIPCLGPKVRAGNLFVVIVTDDSAPEIGPDMAKNSRMMINMIKRNVPSGRTRIVKVPPKSVTPAMVPRFIASLDAGADDAILFYYSGHGAYDETRRQTCLLMSTHPGSILFAEDIRHAIESKHVRFVAIVLDCCNLIRPLRARGPIAPGDPPDAGPPNITPLFDNLFFKPVGSVVIESSAPLEFAITVPALQFRAPRGGITWYRFGSLFTQSFTGVVQGLEDVGQEVPDWPQLCRQTQESIDDQYPELCQKGVIPLANGQRPVQTRQTVMVWVNDQLIQTRQRP
jgi:Caspase domain